VRAAHGTAFGLRREELSPAGRRGSSGQSLCQVRSRSDCMLLRDGCVGMRVWAAFERARLSRSGRSGALAIESTRCGPNARFSYARSSASLGRELSTSVDLQRDRRRVGGLVEGLCSADETSRGVSPLVARQGLRSPDPPASRPRRSWIEITIRVRDWCRDSIIRSIFTVVWFT